MSTRITRLTAVLLAIIFVLFSNIHPVPSESRKVTDEIEKVQFEDSAQDTIDEKSQGHPPVTLSKTLQDMTVTVVAPSGSLPHDTQLDVELLGLEGTDAQDLLDSRFNGYLAFDITLYNDAGEVQPQAPVEVTFSNLGLQGDLEILYIPDELAQMDKAQRLTVADQSCLLESFPSESNKDRVNFLTDHFSIYAVGELEFIDYQFYVDESFYSSQIVKEGDWLYEPSAPFSTSGACFLGWHVDGQPLTFGMVSSLEVSGEDSGFIKVEAKFADLFHSVHFVYQDQIIHTKCVAPKQTTDADDVNLVVTEPGKYFAFWSMTEENANPQEPVVAQPFNFDTEIIHDIYLHAHLEEGVMVTFDSQGGNQILPLFIPKDETLGEVPSPIRQGFSFQGWFTERNGGGIQLANGSSIDQEDLEPNGDLKLYAKWESQDVKYHLVYWLENADDSLYTYKETKTKEGKAGEETKIFNEDILTNRYKFFTYKGRDPDLAIEGDGSTVINIYYSRNKYTLRFRLNRDRSSLTINEKTYGNSGEEDKQYKITAKYNADISRLWPTADHIPDVDSYAFTGWKDGDGLFANIYVSKQTKLTSNMIDSNENEKLLTATWKKSLSIFELFYMIETLNGDAGDGSGGKLREYEGKWYQEDLAYSQIVKSTTSLFGDGNWGAKIIPGVEKAGYEETKEPGETHYRYQYFYYDRQAYDLEFYNPDRIKEKSYLFGSDISDQYFVPPRPLGVPVIYEFAGWFSNPLGEGHAFVFEDIKMPEHGLALYAKWAPPTHTLQYYEVPGGDLKSITDISHRSKVKQDQLIKIFPCEGLTDNDFVGWYWKLGRAFVPFDFDMPIEEDGIILYPVWDSPCYHVTYTDVEGTGQAPYDHFSYHIGTEAKIRGQGLLIAPDGKHFLGWKEDQNDDICYPNSSLFMTDDVNLTAIWGEQARDTDITYQGNGGDQDGMAEKSYSEYSNNSKHQVLDNPFTRQGHAFTCWNTKADGKGLTYQPDDLVILSNDETPNILYAQWKMDQFKVTFIDHDDAVLKIEMVASDGNATPPDNPIREGYVFSGWQGNYLNVIRDETVIATYQPNASTNYQVTHYLQNIEDDGYPEEAHLTENLQGQTGQLTEAAKKEYLGFTAQTFEQKVIEADGKTVIKIYYTRNLYTLTYAITGSYFTDPAYMVKTYKYQAAINEAPKPSGAGYTFRGWDKDLKTMPAEDVTISGYFTKSDVSPYPKPALTVSKQGKYVDKNQDGYLNPGDRIDYTITITNAGQAILSYIQVIDPLLGLDETIAELGVGTSQTLTESYIINWDDIEAGKVINVVTATAFELDDPIEVKVETLLIGEVEARDSVPGDDEEDGIDSHDEGESKLPGVPVTGEVLAWLHLALAALLMSFGAVALSAAKKIRHKSWLTVLSYRKKTIPQV